MKGSSKKLSKKYSSLKFDLLNNIELLEEKPTLGVPIGKDCYKIRIGIKSKGKGKSKGGRLITYFKNAGNTVFLLDIYDKSEQVNISEKELSYLIAILSKGE